MIRRAMMLPSAVGNMANENFKGMQHMAV